MFNEDKFNLSFPESQTPFSNYRKNIDGFPGQPYIPIMERHHLDKRRFDGMMAREIRSLVRDLVSDALAYSGGNQLQAAEALGCGRIHVARIITREELDVERIRTLALEGRWIYLTNPTGAPWASREW